MNNGQVVLSNTVSTQLTEIALEVVALKADPANTNAVWIGYDSTVTVSTGFPLNPGETIVVAIDGNLNELYAIAETNSEILCWIETGR